MKNKGQLFIMSAPSGCGKDTMLMRLLENNKKVKLSISHITRDMREGEVQDEKYHFTDRATFEDMLSNNMFLEHNIYNGNYYGTPKEPIEIWTNEGYDVILEIDVNGAKKVMESNPDVISIFILPPSMETLRKRLIKRGTENEETISKRLKIACEEVMNAHLYDYCVVNDDLETAVKDVESIINAGHLRKDKMKNIIDEVQNDAKSFHR